MSPTDFTDLAGRADNVHRELECDGNTGRIDYDIESVSIPERSSPCDHVFTVRTEGRGCAKLLCNLQSTFIGGSTNNHDLTGAGEFGHRGTEETDGPGSNNGDGIAREN